MPCYQRRHLTPDQRFASRSTLLFVSVVEAGATFGSLNQVFYIVNIVKKLVVSAVLTHFVVYPYYYRGFLVYRRAPYQFHT